MANGDYGYFGKGNQVQNGINMGLRLLLRSPFIVFGSVVMAFTVNVKCAIVFLVTIPILFVAVFGIMLLIFNSVIIKL